MPQQHQEASRARPFASALTCGRAQLRTRCAETKETSALHATLEAEHAAVEEDYKRVEQELAAARSEVRKRLFSAEHRVRAVSQLTELFLCAPSRGTLAGALKAKKALATLAKTEEAVRQMEAMERLKLEAEHNARMNKLSAELDCVREELDIRTRVIGAELVRWRAQAEAAAAAVRDAKDEVRARIIAVQQTHGCSHARLATLRGSSWIASGSLMSPRSAWTASLRSFTSVSMLARMQLRVCIVMIGN